MVHAVNQPSDTISDHDDRTFTVGEANAALPLVRMIAREIMRLQQDIQGQELQLSGLSNRRSASLTARSDFADEVHDMRESLAEEKSELKARVLELQKLGITTHEQQNGTIDGYFDFPSTRNRRRIKLCWHVEEPEVSHWHEPGVSTDRLPVPGNAIETMPGDQRA